MYHFCTEKELKEIDVIKSCDGVAVSEFVNELLKEVRAEDQKGKYVILENLETWRRNKCPQHVFKGYQDECCTTYAATDLFCLERIAAVSMFNEWARESGFAERNAARWTRINSMSIAEQQEAEKRVAYNDDFVNIQDKDTRDFYKSVFKRAENE